MCATREQNTWQTDIIRQSNKKKCLKMISACDREIKKEKKKMFKGNQDKWGCIWQGNQKQK